MKLIWPFVSRTAHFTSLSRAIPCSRADSRISSTLRRSRLALRSITTTFLWVLRRPFDEDDLDL